MLIMVIFKIFFMGEAEQEYLSLIKKSQLNNKYAVRALQIVAETNSHHMTEIVRAIEQAEEAAEGEERLAITSLKHTVKKSEEVQDKSVKSKKRKSSGEKKSKVPKVDEAVEIDREVDRDMSREMGRDKSGMERAEVPEEAENEETPHDAFFPYPPEYYLFKMVDKAEYTESYIYYTRVQEKEMEKEVEESYPELKRSYFIVPRLGQAQKALYSAPMQCKVCGLRFYRVDRYTAHGETHQKKSQIEKTISGDMHRLWMLQKESRGEMEHKAHKKTLAQNLQDETESVPVKGDGDQRCTICKEQLEVTWSDEEECWVFKDALLIRSQPKREICHKKCAT